MSTIGSLLAAAILAFGVVFCVGLSAAVLFWSAASLEEHLTGNVAHGNTPNQPRSAPEALVARRRDTPMTRFASSMAALERIGAGHRAVRAASTHAAERGGGSGCIESRP